MKHIKIAQEYFKKVEEIGLEATNEIFEVRVEPLTNLPHAQTEWQCMQGGNIPSFSEEMVEYRWKPVPIETVTVEIPVAMSIKPEKGEGYWFIARRGAVFCDWEGDDTDLAYFHGVGIYKTEEEAQLAYDAVCKANPNSGGS